MIEVRFTNQVLLGYAILDTDGFYYFEQEGNGWWSEHSLRYVADKLSEINGPYYEFLSQYYETNLL